MNINIIRSGLLSRLAEKRHFLICAPSGFGKTILLEQFLQIEQEAVLIDGSEISEKNLIKKLQEPASVILIDNADSLSSALIGQLISMPVKKKRFILSLHHSNYPKVQIGKQKRIVDVLKFSDLMFSKEEIQFLSTISDAENTYEKTFGWAYPTVLGDDQIAVSAYLDDLIAELPKELYNFLIDFFIIKSVQDTSDPRLFKILDSGFPLMFDGVFYIHSLMQDYLTRIQNIDFTSIDLELTTLIAKLDKMDLEGKKGVITKFFSEKIEDDLNEKEKVKMLSLIPQSELTPHLRDLLIHYLYSINELTDAQRLADLQLVLGCETAFTYATLVRIANSNNDFVASKEYLRCAELVSHNDIDFSKIYNLKAIFHVRHGHFDEARVNAQNSYKHALRSNETYLKILTLCTLGYVEQMAGNLMGAIESSREAMIYCQNNEERFYQRITRLCSNLGDMLKDAGEYEAALGYIQQGLHCLKSSTQGSGPFLYCTRGLIYLELGYFDLAIENFDVSVTAFKDGGYLSGLLLPHTYSAYAAYRTKNWTRLNYHLHELRHLIQRTRSRMDEYREYEFYLPLVEGLVLMSQGNNSGALAELKKINKVGSMTYDSVLLNQLTIGEILEHNQAIDETYAKELLEIIEHRNTPNDCMVVMYREFYFKVLSSCCHFESVRTRFEKILATKIRPINLQKNTEFKIFTLGSTRLVIHGKVIATKSTYPIQALVYLALTDSWVTPKQLGERLFFGNSKDNEGQRRSRASTALNQLSKLLLSLDNDFRNVLQYHPIDGYRLSKPSAIQISIDVEQYLGSDFTDLSDLDTVFSLLRNVRPFQVGLNSGFNDEINEKLFSSVELAALKLADYYESRGLFVKAVLPLVYGLRLTHGFELSEKLEKLCSLLPRALAEKVTALVVGIKHDNENIDDLILIALTSCEQTYPLQLREDTSYQAPLSLN